MANPWLAVDTSTSPAARARIVRRAWEGFLGGERDLPVREPIADSWTRCHDAGVAHAGAAAAPVVADEDEAEARWLAHPLAALTPLIRQCIAPIVDEAHLLVISDAQGVLLWLEGDPDVRRSAEHMNFAAGTLWNEVSVGTNAVGTALAADHAVQVFAAEHFHEVVQTWTCSACPVHDPDSGDVIGVIDLTSRMNTVHSYALAVAVATAQATEAQLRTSMHQRDARLAAVYADRVHAESGPRALLSPHGRLIVANDAWRRAPLRVTRNPESGLLELPADAAGELEQVRRGEAYIARAPGSADLRRRVPSAPRGRLEIAVLSPTGPRAAIDGVAVPLRPRQAEMLALLAVTRNGLTTEELGASLYGDHAKPGSVRVEISRLRKLFGPWMTAQPYRLVDDARCDVRELRALLDGGRLNEAVERHGAGILPRSEAPGVTRERELLGRWLRQAVLASDDADALWSWVSSDAGEDDLVAWRRLLPKLPVRDRRRPFALARTEALRVDLTRPV